MSKKWVATCNCIKRKDHRYFDSKYKPTKEAEDGTCVKCGYYVHYRLKEHLDYDMTEFLAVYEDKEEKKFVKNFKKRIVRDD